MYDIGVGFACQRLRLSYLKANKRQAKSTKYYRHPSLLAQHLSRTTSRLHHLRQGLRLLPLPFGYMVHLSAGVICACVFFLVCAIPSSMVSQFSQMNLCAETLHGQGSFRFQKMLRMKYSSISHGRADLRRLSKSCNGATGLKSANLHEPDPSLCPSIS